jgi:hypothetical protein
MSNLTINIAKEFTLYPGARYRSDGKFSGQQFYEDILKPKLDQVWDKDNEKVEIYLDGTFGYASSFLSEVAVRLVKDFKEKDKILNKIEFLSDKDPLIIETIAKFINEAP